MHMSFTPKTTLTQAAPFLCHVNTGSMLYVICYMKPNENLFQKIHHFLPIKYFIGLFPLLA